MKKGTPGDFFESISSDGYYISGYYNEDGFPIVCEEYFLNQFSIFDLGVSFNEKK